MRHSTNRSGVGPKPYIYLRHAIEGASLLQSGAGIKWTTTGPNVCRADPAAPRLAIRNGPGQKYILECHPHCGCPATCTHRAIQAGPRVKLEVFWTGPEKKWGVRSLVSIPAGGFVLPYAGERVSYERYLERADAAKDNERDEPFYLFALQLLGGHKPCYLDASVFGNASRFLNHACADCNLEGRWVLGEHHDARLPTLAFFAKKAIKPNEELTIFYGDSWAKDSASGCGCRRKGCKNPKGGPKGGC